MTQEDQSRAAAHPPESEPPAAATTEEPIGITAESIVEALLFAADSPVSPGKLAQLIGTGTPGDVRTHADALNAEYERSGRAFRIEEIAKGYQMLTLPEYNVWLRKLLNVRSETKLSPAALETLAVVAYKQPVLRAKVEEIRGVAAGEMLQRLREMNMVKIVGRAEEIGRPMLYGTTKRFLEVFGLNSLKDLPQIESLTPPEKQKPVAENAPETTDASERTLADVAEAMAAGDVESDAPSSTP